ncbi:SMI1/KNR4 family protein [Thalassomonas viridans]|uniref:SMI1/KNR4 family protein n=1 Tax=Thalassomonas viridans TaxID=137584 RepID=A0AAE9Z5C4_9GAMM|nr:SMI1/KNR4 family protein [Thalassomonas viridans]WDE07041.1 SMI1/KNR4 family protein [Thalassomonas viridans]
MTPKVHDSIGSNSINAIEKLENHLGVRFTLQYREFLSKYNGGYPEPDGFLFKNRIDGSSVDRFLGINVGEHNNLEDYFFTYKNRISKKLFPIAHDPGGNLILIGLSGEELDKIYFWDHEEEADGWNPDMTNVYLIADNLEEFLSGLYEIDI